MACGDDKKEESSDETATSDPPSQNPEVSYEDSIDGLTSLFRTAIAEIGAGKSEKVGKNLSKLSLEDPKAWFSEHFDAALAKELTREYEQAGPRAGEMESLLRSLIDKGQVQVKVERFKTDTDKRAVGYQALALKRMTMSTALYSVRITKPDEESGFHLWSFVHDGKRFRWVGKMKSVSSNAPEVPDKLEVRVELLSEL